jgi:hypothetical protein
MKTFQITQLITYESIYEIEAETEEEALFKLQTEHNEPVGEEYHSMNSKEDWKIEVLTGATP